MTYFESIPKVLFQDSGLMPLEIKQLVFRYLGPYDLIKVEQVCRYSRSIVSSYYPIYYSPSLPHRQLNVNFSWRDLVLERAAIEAKLSPEKPTCVEVIRKIQKRIYTCGTYAHDYAAKYIVALNLEQHKSATIWQEAMATCLMMQNRFIDAETVYRQHCLSADLPQRILPVAWRFGWPFIEPLPKHPSNDVRQLEILGAAAAGNLKLVQNLHAQGANIDTWYQDLELSIGMVAAQADSVPILKYLSENNVNLLENEQYPDFLLPLQKACKYGSIRATEYLLELERSHRYEEMEAYYTYKKALEIASVKGHLEIFKQIIKHRISLGKPIVPSFFLHPLQSMTPAHLKESLNFLVEEVHIDLNTTDDFGRSMSHYAALDGDMDLIEVLCSKGADLLIEDIYGLTALEISAGRGEGEFTEYVASYTQTVEWHSRDEKLALAMEIAESESEFIIDHLGSYYGHDISKLRAKWSDSDITQANALTFLQTASFEDLRRWRDEVIVYERFQLTMMAYSINFTSGDSPLQRLTTDQEDLERRHIACHLTKILCGPRNNKEKFARGLRTMSTEQLDTLKAFYDETFNVRFAAGMRARVSLLMGIVRPVRQALLE